MYSYLHSYSTKRTIGWGFLLIVLFFFGFISQAQVAGPRDAGIGSNVLGTGTVNWVTPGNITANDVATASANLSSSTTSRYLVGSNYGFTIPATAVINGIVVTIGRNGSSTANGVKDAIVRLVKSSTVTGSNYAAPLVIWPSGTAAATYGGATNLWGTTWTASEINDPNFGVALSASALSNRTAHVNYMQITVYYTPPPTISNFSPGNACIGSTPNITISGNHFLGATAVTFNGIAATSFTVNSNNQITATLPANATTGNISVTTPSGTVVSAGTFTVNPLPVLAPITGIVSLCLPSSETLSNTTSGGIWSSATPAVATINASGVVLAVSPGTSLITYTYTNSNGCTSAVTTTVTVNARPIVSTPSNICVGSTTQLSPSTGGTWTSSSALIASIDNSGLVTGLTPGNATFTFTETATNCSAQTTSLTVFPTAVITAQPISLSVCTGTNATFSISATGNALTYQWYKDGLPLSDSANISGATTSVLTINPTTLTDISSDYYCVINDTCTVDLTSDIVSLNVTEGVTLTGQPAASQTFCVGDSATLSVSATGAGVSYQWYNGLNALSDSATVSGSATSTLTITALTIADASTVYHCLVSGTSPCNPVASSNATILVNAAPTIDTHPVTIQDVCDQGSATISVVASGGNLTYQWYKGATALMNGGNISGANTSNLVINPAGSADAGADYYCEVTNGCATGAVSNTATLNINPKAIIPAQTATACSQGAFSVTPTNGVPTSATIVPANTTYSWPAPIVTGGLTGGSAQSNQTSVNGTLVNPTNSDQTATYTVTPSSGSTPCTGSSFTVVVTVKPVPSILPINRTICSENNVTVTPSNGSGNIVPAGTTYSWPTPTVTGGITGGLSGSNQTGLSHFLTNPTTSVQTATYTITPTSGMCSGSPFTLTVTVNPKPAVVANIISQNSCSGAVHTPILISNPAGFSTSYTWTRNNTTNVLGTSSGSSGTILAGASFSLSNVLTNITTIPQTVDYTITPTSNGCPGASITASVVVSAPSVGGAVTISQPAVLPVITTTTVCHFATGALYLSGHTGSVVRWEYTITGGVTWVPITNTASTYNYVNITQTTIFRAVTQNGASCGLAYSTPSIVNVVPNIKPTPVTATPPTICIGGSSVLNSQSGYATSQYVVTGGTFSNSNPANWTVDGCGNCLNAGASNTAPGGFQLSATNGGTYSGVTYTSVGKFAIANGNFTSYISTPVFNTFGLNNLTISFDHAYNLLAGAWATVELSLDGGATYSVVLAQYNGPSTRTPYNNFPNTSIDLSQYLGQASLKVRFTYHGTVGSSWAIDNIQLPEAPANVTMQWIDSSTGQVISTTATATVSPTVTTTYAITSMLNGCTSFGPEGTTYVTVTVNPRPTANIGANQTICRGGTATFSVALTGVAPWNITYSNGTTTTTVNNITTNPYVFSVNNILTNQTYTITALSDSRCTSIASDLTGSAAVAVLNGTQGLWTGLVSTDWFDCMNWAGGLPSPTVNAVIPAGVPRMPLINPSTSPYAATYGNIAQARDIIIATNASLTMAPSSTSDLEVNRDWKNSGVFTPGVGTVTFNSNTTALVQTINQGIKTNETFYNLTVNTSNGAKGISVVNAFELTVANNLSLLSGDLRLTGEAQLVQTGLVANPTSGTGKLLRDQQGTKSSFNFNYWSSPVSVDNVNYSVAGVLRDGTDVTTDPFNPGTINFANGVTFADGPATNPIKISNSWINKYTAISTSYFSWQFIGSTGNVKIGEGFTMKGTDGIAAISDTQNYVFAGKPNNGTINLSIAPGQNYLIGNPYASALDADQFIRDNIKDGGNAAVNSFTGALYFWDHFGGHTHLLSQYVGGYATYTLMGGVVAVANSPLNINNGATGSKVPKRYIPVGQGFFIQTVLDPLLTTNNPGLTSPVTGGPIIFKNSQRAFRTESAANSVFFRQSSIVDANQDDRLKIRLMFDSPSGLHRRLLVGADQYATSMFDLGYDAPMIDINVDEMFWKLGDSKFVIQAVSDFNETQIIPLGVKLENGGLSTISIDGLENVTEETNIYLYDSATDFYHDLKDSAFTIDLPIGEYNDRFSLRFASQSLGVTNPSLNNGMNVTFANDHVLHINNDNTDAEVTEVYFFNLLGQAISNSKVENQDQLDIKIPLQNVAQGTYIVKIKSTKGYTSTKIMVK